MKNSAIALCLIFLGACAPLQAQTAVPPIEVTDFDSCVAAGNIVLRTFPPKCAAKNGKIYTKTETKKIGGMLCKDQCGDGVCQEIVCKAEGCPCAETPQNCPKDCAPDL